MTTRWCIIQGGVVVNTILWDGETEYDPGEGVELVPEGTPGLVYPVDDFTEDDEG